MGYVPPPKDLKPGAIVWAYIRDSGGEAQEQSVKQQEAEIRAYCQQHGLILSRVFVDEARSGGSVAGREAFQEMMALSEDPTLCPQGILVWNFARFAREVRASWYYKAKLRWKGIVVHSLTDPIPPGHYGHLVEAVIDISNEEKRLQTSRDVKRALHALVREGYSCGGRPPRGYKAEKVVIGQKRNGQPRIVSRWVPDPNLWDLVKLAWKLRAEGKSYAEITKATKGRLYRSSASWASFFRNKTYLGIGKCGNEEIPDHHPAAVDLATWEKVQQINQNSRSWQNPRRHRSPSLLSGIAECAHCGAKMSYEGGKWPFYICGTKTRQGYKACPSRRINARKADQAILKQVLDYILTPKVLQQVLEAAYARLANPAQIEAQKQQIKRALAQVNRAIGNLLDLAEQFGAQSAAERLKAREIERARLLAELQRIEAQEQALQAPLPPEIAQTALTRWRESLLSATEGQDVLQARRLLQQFVTRIELDYGKARIWYTYPVDAILSGPVPDNHNESPWGH